MARDVYLLPVDHDPFKPGIQGEDEEARAYADRPSAPMTSSSLAHLRSLGFQENDLAEASRLSKAPMEAWNNFLYSPHLPPEYKQRFREEVIDKPFTGLGVPGLLAGTYEAGKGMVEGGLSSIRNWMGATRGHPEVIGNPELIAPRGTEDYEEGPISPQSMLAPTGVAGMGSPVSALGREALRGGAKSYSPSLGEGAGISQLTPEQKEWLQRPGDRSSGAADASDALNPKAVKDLYARQGLPVPGEDGRSEDESRIYLVPVDHNPFAPKKTAAATSPGARPGPEQPVWLGETPQDTQQRQYNEHLRRLFEMDAAAPYGPDALAPEMGGRMPVLDPDAQAERRGMQQHFSPRTRTLRPF